MTDLDLETHESEETGRWKVGLDQTRVAFDAATEGLCSAIESLTTRVDGLLHATARLQGKLMRARLAQIDLVPEPFVVTDGTTVLHANLAFCAALGYERDEVEGRPWADFTLADTSPVTSDGAVLSAVHRHRTKEGEELAFDWRCSPVQSGRYYCAARPHLPTSPGV